MGRMVQGSNQLKTVILLAGIAGLSLTPVCMEHKLQAQINPQLCKQIVDHKPAPDVEYKGGVDVHGKPVVEADLNPSPVKIPEKISFDVTVDMAKYLGLSTAAGVEQVASIGTIAYEKGVLTFNGEPMEGPAAASLRELCATPDAPKKTKEIKHNKD